MTTTSVKVSELTKAPLRYAVAVAAEYQIRYSESVRMWFVESVTNGDGKPTEICPSGCELAPFEPDLDWSQLEPLIEAHWMAICNWMESYWGVFSWHVFLTMKGENMKVWFCRAIAASCWGEYADIPSELVQEQSDE